MKVLKLSSLFVVLSMIVVGCVSERKYSELKTQYDECVQKRDKYQSSLAEAETQLMAERENAERLRKDIASLRIDSAECYMALERTKKLYNDLQDLQQRIIANSRDEQDRTKRDLLETSDLLKQRELDVMHKEEQLRNTELRIKSLEADLAKREARVMELERILRAKDSTVLVLKDKMQKALFDFQNNGLTVEVKNGKVYVSMQEKLLFKSGSIEVDPQGKKALLELAKVLMEQQDVTIMVEGHTDDVPILKGSYVKDNWDLSVLRATSIVRILTDDGKIEPKRIIASGRGEYFPLNPLKTPEARAMNRRTEIILTPNLDELFKILSN
ncbi:MAG: OmpA family protein [Bacteroidia bacterium]|nr:OmpA family protein [Bacteroidota bacterium]MCZ2129612.1 OmpA family protein [Bacteroidia bacterium]